jgi:Arc/MetJ family transcription regulator
LCLAFANRNSIDIDDAVRAKVTKNHQKYPVEKFKGRF